MATTVSVPAGAVDRVRAFNRFYTRVIGVLRAGLVDSPYSLTEARVLYELAQADRRGRAVEVGGLRRDLELDSGYLSRILGRLTAEGLAVRSPSDDDGRRQVVRVTEAGRAAFAVLDGQQAAAVAGLLAPLSADARAHLLGAMDVVEGVLAPDARPRGYLLRAPGPGDLGWVVARHGALYAEECGWDARFEGMVARIAADYVEHHDPAREAGWIAEMDGRPVGSVFCVDARLDALDAGAAAGETVHAGTAKLRLLLVEPSARGLGIGARLVRECLDFARRVGYSRITLWTDDQLLAARAIYQKAGFTLDAEEPHHSYGQDLVGQYWSRDL
jgi:DNA-binding MarR family transcriptional regulator/GNAT superfamily N-acetyltransferase